MTRIARALCLPLLIWGCREEDNGTCQDLGLDQCLSDSTCDIISYSPVVGEGEDACVDTTEVVDAGCNSTELICNDDVPVFAREPGGDECRWFPNSCLPFGWEVCGNISTPVCD